MRAVLIGAATILTGGVAGGGYGYLASLLFADRGVASLEPVAWVAGGAVIGTVAGAFVGGVLA